MSDLPPRTDALVIAFLGTEIDHLMLGNWLVTKAEAATGLNPTRTPGAPEQISAVRPR
jgi:hypothetical protein